MKMSYAIVIRLGNQWCHRDDIFGIVVLDGTKVAKLTLICIVVGYDIRSLHIDPFAFWFCTYKVNLDRKSTRLNSSHANISYAVFCLKKNKMITCILPIIASVEIIEITPQPS